MSNAVRGGRWKLEEDETVTLYKQTKTKLYVQQTSSRFFFMFRMKVVGHKTVKIAKF